MIGALRCGMIVAMNAEGLIATADGIPWHHPCDLKHFKRRTWGRSVIMGRKTWDSLSGKALPGRTNIVVSHAEVQGAQWAASLEQALSQAGNGAWVIGGAEIYAQAFPYCDLLDITMVPDVIHNPIEPKYFPRIDYSQWHRGEEKYLCTDSLVWNCVYRRI